MPANWRSSTLLDIKKANIALLGAEFGSPMWCYADHSLFLVESPL